MTYIQKGLNNKDKKELKERIINNLINNINKIQFTNDWYGTKNSRALTNSEIISKYNLPDGRYLREILLRFNLNRRSTEENNLILIKKRNEDKLNYLISNIDLNKFSEYHKDHTQPEMLNLFNIKDRDYNLLLDYLKLEKHSPSESQKLAQKHMSREKKEEIVNKRMASITDEIELVRRNKISITSMNKSSEEKKEIYSRASTTAKNRTPEQKFSSKQKEYETRIKNGTLWTSKPEDKFKEKLYEVYGEEDVEWNYNKDPRYKHKCDFYIKSLDLFIELNFHPSHWAYYKYKEPFNPNNKDHIKWCETRKELGYNTWIWKHSDYNKIQDAYNNNLNYIAFYDQKSFENDEDIVYSLAKVKGVHLVPSAH